jgi:hypothetical protein
MQVVEEFDNLPVMYPPRILWPLVGRAAPFLGNSWASHGPRPQNVELPCGAFLEFWFRRRRVRRTLVPPVTRHARIAIEQMLQVVVPGFAASRPNRPARNLRFSRIDYLPKAHEAAPRGFDIVGLPGKHQSRERSADGKQELSFHMVTLGARVSPEKELRERNDIFPALPERWEPDWDHAQTTPGSWRPPTGILRKPRPGVNFDRTFTTDLHGLGRADPSDLAFLSRGRKRPRV